MNYTRYNLERKEDELTTRSHFSGRRAAGAFVKTLLLIIAAVIVIGIAGGAGIIAGCISSAPDVSEINIAPSGFATFIYNSSGNQLQKLTSSNSNRQAVSIDNVPDALQHAVVAIEDERFYQHNGIDPKGILRAFVVGVKNRFHFTEGASTITQQLLKNNVFVGWTEERSLIDRAKRKFQEQYLAIELEKKLQNKDLILENYLNTINLGAGTYGVQAASRKYFDKDVWELTLSECTVLAGITQNPSRYNPIRHPENNAERRERILKKMVEQKYITQAEMDDALADPVYERIEEAQAAQAAVDTVYSYFVDELTEEVVKDLQAQLGYTENAAYQTLYSGGLRIYTTLDSKIQSICDEEFSDPANFPAGTTYALDWALTVTDKDGETVNYSKEMLRKWFREQNPDFSLSFESEEAGKAAVETYKAAVLSDTDTIVAEKISFSPEPQSSMVIMDQFTGYVKAIEGGRGKKTASLTLNRATNTYRQPGSTFKILSTYAPAFNQGIKTPGSIVNDEPLQYSTGDEVHNSSGGYLGWITLREAITRSVNVAAVKTLQEITPYAGYEQLLKFGFTSLDPVRDVVEPLALGGISKGVSNIELTAAYAAIANGGTYIRPIFYTRIYDQNGEILLDNVPESHEAISADTAWMLTSTMMDVVKDGTGTACALASGMPVAGKTGTTNDYRNLWFVGYTPYYTMGIWAGYDDNTSLPDDEVSRNYHKQLWNKIMTRVSEKQYITDFKIPATVQKVQLCGVTGLLAGDGCDFVTDDYVSSAFCPTERCTLCGGGGYSDDYYPEFDTDETDITDQIDLPDPEDADPSADPITGDDQEEEDNQDYDDFDEEDQQEDWENDWNDWTDDGNGDGGFDWENDDGEQFFFPEG